MTYVSTNYANNSQAPVGKWTCAPTSSLQPYGTPPPMEVTNGHNLCGQCVSYVKKVCPSLPPTHLWRKGEQVKGNTRVLPGTVIATFDPSGHYHGHAAIFVSQNEKGIQVMDQYISGHAPKPVGGRLIHWGWPGTSNDGDKYYVVE